MSSEHPSERTLEPVLHLHPLSDEHGDALISGNREGLRILKDRIERALSATRGHNYYMDHGYTDNPDETLFAADGEGYHLGVECAAYGPHDPNWLWRPEPYYVSRRRAREHGMNV